MYYQNLTPADLQKYLKKRRDLIVPFGSVERHGPHLPYFTDTFALDGILNEFSKKNSVLIAPTVPYVITRSIENMPGTLTLDFETANNYFKDIFNSFIKWGFTKFYLITYHASGPHLVSISESIREINKTLPKIIFEGVHLWNILRKIGKKQGILESEQEEVHAGEIETSLMLYLKPNLVKKSKMINEKIEKNEFDFINPLRLNKSGVYGQAKLASRSKGKKLVSLAVKELNKIFK